jgi:hypothetical protein
MASNWARDLPVVTVPTRGTAKPVTFVYPYYENARFFQRQLRGWQEYPDALAAQVSIVVVDDGSPTTPAARVLAGHAPRCRVRLFRIEPDVPWNWLAARNIGAHHAADGWLLLTDMDHVVPAQTLAAVVYGAHDPDVVYGFSRVEHTGAPVPPHSASFLMTKAMFWTVGGYDERFSGSYGTDGMYRRRLLATAPIQILSDVLVRHERIGDASTTAYARKLPADAARIKAIQAQIPAGSKPAVLTFPYYEVARC